MYKHKRPLSPKFGQHLATIKYGIVVPRLFLSHVYMDDSRAAWSDGVTPFVGVKAFMKKFQADMHQRAQESMITKADGTTKTVLHKSFHAVEVVLNELELRSVLAIFEEPLKQRVPLEPSQSESTYRTREDIPVTEPGSVWVDIDDFMDTHWMPNSEPTLHHLLLGSCPRFTYFKQACATAMKDRVDHTKFGDEDTHVCFLGKEACEFGTTVLVDFYTNTYLAVPRIQMHIAQQRIEELCKQVSDPDNFDPRVPDIPAPEVSLLMLAVKHSQLTILSESKHGYQVHDFAAGGLR
jgi:hypothetical protein